MKTIADNHKLTPQEALEQTKKAKGGDWYEGWLPFCVQEQVPCNSMSRMRPMSYGFKCDTCGNMIGYDLTRLKESPLNNKK